MPDVNIGRAFMGDSLGFHILFALLGVGLPLCVSIIEFIAWRRKDEKLRDVAKLWSFIAGVLVVAGAVSGAIVALQMFFVWPGVLKFGGGTIGLGFTLEGYAFLVEAVFLVWYLRSWKTIQGFKHWLIGIPISIGATGSAIFITSVNAWMNHPTGMTVVNGVITSSNPMAALFSETTLYEASHSILAYYMITALLITASAAWVLIRSRKGESGESAFGSIATAHTLLRWFGALSLILLIGVAVLGDLSGKYIAREEPTKLAALEMLEKTQHGAPAMIGGSVDSNGTIQPGIEIPGVLSFLATGDFNGEVKGLDQVPRHLWPPLVVHTIFDIKMLLVGVLAAIVGGFVLLYAFLRKWALSRPVLYAVIASPGIATIVMELGWVMTEIGRQPYAVYGYIFTKDAFTTSHSVLAIAWIFPTLYIFLTLATVLAIRVTIKKFIAPEREEV
ncbi:MAG TPA: cytochrome ubiquinol oxidase subunit I [Candidatus Saccharimonadales bacterium]|nr:cytochrome ubiquinol oxidase subunit I [Candidatus Saccharimonadales bacterium]